MKPFSLFGCAILLSSLWITSCLYAYSHGQSKEQQPNIVIVLADDLGVFDLGCYGRSDHRTPHLDRLAEQGVRYTSAYCGLSICSPSRAALMTGKTPARLHLTTYLPGRPDADSQLLLHPRIQPNLPLEEKTVAEVLQTAGYRTGLFGKWHLGGGPFGPTHQGFEVVEEIGESGKLDDVEGGKNEFRITNAAIAFLKADASKPALCYVPHHSPHIRVAAPQSLVDENAAAFNPLYAAALESLDQSVGRLLEAIDKLERPTIVVFASDNGGLHVPEGHEQPVTHNGPYRAGKGYLHEGGLRVPLIVRWPGSIRAGQVVDTPVSLMDLMPTLLEIAGLDVSKTVGPLDGISLRSQWLGQADYSQAQQRPFFWHFPHYTNQGSRPAAAMRLGDWKLIRSLEDNQLELYDLNADVGEKRNLAKDQHDRAQSMNEMLSAWQRRVAVQPTSPNPEADRELHRQIYLDTDTSQIDATLGALQIGNQLRAWRTKMNQAVAGRKPVLKDVQHEIRLPASAVKAHGKNIRYEPEPHKNVVGYWTEVDDWAEWEVKIPKDGQYEVEVQCGCGAGGGSEVELSIGEQRLSWTVRDTGHFQHMVVEPVGTMELKAGTHSLAVRPKSKSGVAIIDIRTIVLRPIDD